MRTLWMVVAAVVLASSCHDADGARAAFCQLRPEVCTPDGGVDAGVDASVDAGWDAGAPDAGAADAGVDAGTDAGVDAGRCGDRVVNEGEYCDDGNDASADECDPTCRFGNRLTWLSGYASSQSFADSTAPLAARFYSVSGLTNDGERLWVADRYLGAVREVALDSGVVTTVLGGPQHLGVTTQDLMGPIDVGYHLLGDGGVGAMYVADDEPGFDGGLVYRVDLRVQPPELKLFWPLTSDVIAVAPGYLGWSEQLVVLTEYGLQRARVFPTGGFGSDGPLALSSQLSSFSVASARCLDVEFGGRLTAPDGGPGAAYYFGCPSSIGRVTTLGGAPTLVGGVAGSSACVDGAASVARIGEPVRLTWEPSSNSIVFADRLCKRVRRLSLANGSISTIAGAGGTPERDGPNAQANFGSLTSVAVAGGDVFAGEVTRVRRVTSTQTSTFVAAPPRPGQQYGADAGYIGLGGIAVDDAHLWAVVYFQQQLFQVDLDGGAARPLATLTSMGGSFPGPIVRVGDALYVSYANGAVRRVALADLPRDGGIAPAGSIDTEWASVTAGLSALATDGTSIYGLTNDRRVVEVGPVTRVIAGRMDVGPPLDGVGPAARFAAPTSLTYGEGALYVLDGPVMPGSTLVRQIQLDGGLVTTLAGVNGVARRVDGAGGDGGVARLAGAVGLAAGPGVLLIGEAGAGAYQHETEAPTLRLFDLRTGQLTTAAGQPGQFSFLSGVGSAAMVNSPRYMTWSPALQRFVLFDTNEFVFATFR